jgi:small subunit ribosomal protein S7
MNKTLDLTNTLKKNKPLDLKIYLYKTEYSKMFNIYINTIIGKLLKQGKKEMVIKIFFNLKYLLKSTCKRDAKIVLFASLINSLVRIHFFKKRLGGQKKSLPIYINNRRKITFMVKNLFKFSYIKKKKLINIEKLLDNIIKSSERKGPLIKKNYMSYKLALENRVFIRFSRKRKKLLIKKI